MEKGYQHCKRATYLIEKKHFVPLNLFERIGLSYHLSKCALCTLYNKHSSLLERFLKQVMTADSKEQGMESGLDVGDKIEMIKAIKDSLNK